MRERKKGARGRQKARSGNLAFNFENEDDDDDDDDEDDSDEEDSSDEDDETKNSETVKAKSEPQQFAEKSQPPLSKHIKTSSIEDPILTTHAKCLSEDILCSWKRVPVQSKQPQPGNKSKTKETHLKFLF